MTQVLASGADAALLDTADGDGDSEGCADGEGDADADGDADGEASDG
jgi:hypothetical protein